MTWQVARYKYLSSWWPLEAVFAAMNTTDFDRGLDGHVQLLSTQHRHTVLEGRANGAAANGAAVNGAAANGLDHSRGWITLSPHDPTKPPLPPLPPPAPSPSFIEIGECVRQVPTNDAIKVTACFAEPKGVATDWPLATD